MRIASPIHLTLWSFPRKSPTSILVQPVPKTQENGFEHCWGVGSGAVNGYYRAQPRSPFSFERLTLPCAEVFLALCYNLKPTLIIVFSWKNPPSQGNFFLPRVQHTYNDPCIVTRLRFLDLRWTILKSHFECGTLHETDSVCIIVQPCIWTEVTEELFHFS